MQPDRPVADQPRIIIVDDDRETREMLATLLESEGFHVMQAANGLKLISILHADHPDLIVLDVNLSWIDGFELCQAVKHNEEFREIPVVFLSGRTGREDIERGMSMGAVEYFRKPVDFDSFAGRLRQIVEERRPHPQGELSVSTGFALDAWLSSQKSRVEALLADRIDRVRSATPPRLHEAMRYSLLDGGKRLRPVLCLAFAEAVAAESGGGGAVAEDAACALEYVHTYSLVHDDLPAMDDDDLRRGRPTNHKVFGEAFAILAGDALLTEAFALTTGGPESVRGALAHELARGAGAIGMVGGQVMDIAEDRPAELAYLTRLHQLKTGALIRAACRMGALAGGGGARELAIAETYGDAVGLAFQIADDLLDVTATAEQMGKPTGADAAAGRFTYPAVVGLERAKAMAKEHVARAVEVVQGIEAAPGPLAALAHYALERRS